MRCRVGKIYLILAVIVIFSNIQAAQAEKAAERVSAYQVKAVFIYNFIQLVEWPATASANTAVPIEIGIFGKDPFGAMIDEVVEGARIQGRLIRVRHSVQLSDLQSCQIVFISRSEAKFLPRFLSQLEGRPILTISDMDQFAKRGGMIGFITQGNKIRFQVNLKVSRKAGLKISSKVLHLAEIIEGTAEDENKQV